MEEFGTPYMTQAEELPIEARIFWTRIIGMNATAEGLRGATAEERNEWLNELNKLNPRYGKH